MDETKKYKNFLKDRYPFSDIPDDILKEIASKVHAHHYGIGRTIYKKGDKGDIFYIVSTGSVYEIITDNEGEEIVVSVLNQGGCFGAVSLLTDESHLVTTKVKEDAELYVIYKNDLDMLIEEYPVLNRYLNRILKNKIEHFFAFFEKEKIKVVSEIRDAGEKEKELSILTKAAELMNSKDPDTVLQSIIEEMRKMMNVDAGFVFLLDPLSGELILETASGRGEGSVRSAKIRIDEGITGWVVRNGEPASVEDIHSDSRVKFISKIHEEELTSLLSVPLIERGNVIGAINITTLNKRRFSYQEIRGAMILANHIALAVSNSQLRRRVEAIDGTMDDEDKHDFDRFVGDTAYVRKINSFIEYSSKDDSPVLIEGEEGTGKTSMAKLIHRKSRRQQGPFIVVDCRTFDEGSWGQELFGAEKISDDAAQRERYGYLELADRGTIFLRNVDALNKVNQVKLYSFLRDGRFNRVNGRDVLKSNVRLISTVSIDIKREAGEERFNKNTYEYLARAQFYMEPLKKRRKDITIITEYILEKLNWELHKNIRKISDMGMERLLSYDWPGNIAELENVLRRAVILTKDDKILSEQIFFGIPRVERKWEFNLLSFKSVKEFLLNRSYPALLQKINTGLFGVFLFILFLGPGAGNRNPASLILWSAGWFFLYVSTLVIGRLWCGICPFSLIGDRLQKIKSFAFNVPKGIVRYSSVILTISILAFFWIEGVSAITYKPRFTAYLFLSIPLGAAVFSVLYERHVWCRYFCPLGGLTGLYSIFSFLTLKANRKICLSQCQTHECYRGGKVKGCQLFLHPYGLENNQHCILCMYCLKNCNYSSIHLPVRLPFVQIPYIESSAYIFSYLSLMLNGIFLVENHSLLSRNSMAFNKIAMTVDIPGTVLYTVLFFAAASFPIAAFYLFNMIFNKVPFSKINARVKTFGAAFLPVSLMGHIAFYLKRVMLDGRNFGKGVEMIYNLFHVGAYRLGPGLIIEMLIILAGAAGSGYIIFQTERRFMAKYELKQSSVKGEIALLGILTAMYGTVICL